MGACRGRDTAQIAPMAFPVYCTSIRPISGTADTMGEVQVPVMCGGVTVDPGDWVFGDNDGIIVGTRQEFEEVVFSMFVPWSWFCGWSRWIVRVHARS